MPKGEQRRDKRREEKSYDPDTTVYCDALWKRVHAPDCPELILKDKKKTMTLKRADKQGWRIGESGQSGREKCCFHGYERKHPPATFDDDHIFAGNDRRKKFQVHVPGCHRYDPDRNHKRKTKKEWIEEGFTICEHCIERGPNLAEISDEVWKTLGPDKAFKPPKKWSPTAYSIDTMPPQRDLDILVQETLSNGCAIQELPFADPVAAVENFMGMRFFFPVGQWLLLYQTYRGTGDKRTLDMLRESARHYNKLAQEYLEAAQTKAKDPEGLAFMYSMAASARITLQLARRHPTTVTKEEIKEAGGFLKTIMSVLKPICEGNENLDEETGIPQKLADDFCDRASNRAMNGIGTIAMATRAMEDFQAIKNTTEFQPTIDRYRTVVQEYVKHFLDIGHLCNQIKGRPMFVYPYGQELKPKQVVDGCKIYKRFEDGGHFSHMLQGAMLIYESMPETGLDDNWMTAVANTVQYCRTHKIQKGKKEVWSGHFQCITAYRVAPQGGEDGHHGFSEGAGSNRFYMLEAFQSGVIDALNTTADAHERTKAAESHEGRLKTLHAMYMKALRKDRTLIHLGETVENYS